MAGLSERVICERTLSELAQTDQETANGFGLQICSDISDDRGNLAVLQNIALSNNV